MNDLSGLSWNNSTSNSSGTQQHPTRSTPSPGFSRQSTPASNAGQTLAPGRIGGSNSAASKPATNDSFSSLLSPQPARPIAASVSLEERQRQLNLQRSQAAGNQDPFAASDAKFWDGLGSGSGSRRGTPAPADAAHPQQSGDSDLLAAFSAAAPVDKSSHYPPPSRSAVASPAQSSRGVSPSVGSALPKGPSQTVGIAEEDDDPFGLSQLASQSRPTTTKPVDDDDDDDILGDLGKPVEETLAARKAQEDVKRAEAERKVDRSASKEDQALAELLDMGFDIEKSKRALAKTSSGHDVQAAISVILNDAHGKPNGAPRAGSQTRRKADHSERQASSQDRDSPAWMRKAHSPARPNATSSNGEDKEISQYASDIGASVWRSANTFWKAGQKRVAKAVADLQQEGDPNQPKWMKDANLSEQPEHRPDPGRSKPRQQDSTARTAEANLLDIGTSNPRQRSTEQSRPRRQSLGRDARTQETKENATDPRSRPQPIPQRQLRESRASERVNRKFVEEESAQAYVSPARRKKAEPKPQVAPEPQETLDIFSDAPAPATAPAIPAPVSSGQQARPRQALATGQPRPAAPARKTPNVSDSVLRASRTNRGSGGASFKQGDYAAAHASYTNALSGMPKEHPITIVIYCNRALTSLKTGDAKGAIIDADAALSIIGPSSGEGESIDMGDEGTKPMREFFGKALMRKAEANEHLEKWTDAAQAWRQAVQAGVGGSVAIQGRNRCEKAAAPTPAPAAVPVKQKTAAPARPRPKTSALAELNGTAQGEAVKRLREQTAAAAAASDEAFALTDAVDAKLTAWKSGKADNLRGLLASLDTVLWPDAGWNKVGMGDLVLPNRVKIVYMKAIAKVHPDKLSQSATTEQKMISASVFATLNEAWDKFKKDNGM